jgi:predicted molibdopterin-dependent oxidoreductase YjgC
MSLGSRSGELMRIVARDRYVNGLNGEFLCIKGRFGHPFVNHEARIRTPLIRYKKGGKLIPATWDEAIRHVAKKLDDVVDAHGRNALGVVGSPRITNEANYLLHKFATELVGTENYTATESSSLRPFFDNLGGPLATHRDIRYAKTILLIGGEPEELQPLTGKQIRQAVRNGGANLIIINSVPIRLTEQASQFLHIRPGTEDAAVLALASSSDDNDAAVKLGIEANELETLRRTITDSQGDLIIMFGAELSATAQSVLAQLPYALRTEARRVLLHPLPLFNNSVGAHDMGLMNGGMSSTQMLDAAGGAIRALYLAGSFLPEHLQGREGALEKLDFLVVQELFETDTTAFADVVLPAASFAEIDGTFTNNDGFVQRVRQSIPPVNQAKADWMITAQLAAELGMNFGFEMSASAVFREIAERVPAYAGLRYPVLKDESNPVQAKYKLAEHHELTSELNTLRQIVEGLPTTGDKLTVTPKVGHELFKIGTLTDKVPQFHLLASGNPRPETVRVSPLYQITVDADLRQEAAVSGD